MSERPNAEETDDPYEVRRYNVMTADGCPNSGRELIYRITIPGNKIVPESAPAATSEIPLSPIDHG